MDVPRPAPAQPRADAHDADPASAHATSSIASVVSMATLTTRAPAALRRRALLQGGGALVLSLGAAGIARGATIVAVRVWPAADYTRVTLESDSGLVGQHFVTSDPARLVIDVDGLELNPALRELVTKVSPDDPHIARVRLGQNQANRVRIVFDLKQASRPQVFALAPIAPYRYRLVFDLYPAVAPDPMAALARAPSSAPTTPPAPAPAAPPPGPAVAASSSEDDDALGVFAARNPAEAGASTGGSIGASAGTTPQAPRPASATVLSSPDYRIRAPASGSPSAGAMAGSAMAGGPAATPGAPAVPPPTATISSPTLPPPVASMPAPPVAAAPAPAAPTAATPHRPTTGATTGTTTARRGRGKGAERLVIVAIDPGHGGEDPGAIGPTGLREKDVVLAIARQLAARIDARPGMRAMLTRDADYFVPLYDRVAKARRVQADLFMSIHADAFVRPHAKGASVFALSQRGASSATARWMAQRENLADAVGGINLADTRDQAVLQTLLDMSTARQIKDSLKVGREVLGRIGRVAPLHRGEIEQAGFAVLKAPDIPSILVETAFISNPQEEKRLRSEAYRSNLVTAMLSGITTYFERNPPLPRSGSA